ncbi:N-acetylmuramoyl-L-alanine amidase [Mycobacteroides chelonae]|uniref:N-acetylmuramoyl-L-alanine amidase n=1 Tax=Mycobacteroides chelonae TaxID=1774 RepID=UPI0039E88D91
MSTGLRRASAVLAVAVLAIGGAKVASDHAVPGSGFSTVQTAAADPTGPTGGPGGDGGMNGSQFQPPGLPPQQPDYQGGVNQPPLDQNSGISIYNTGSPGQQVPGQQGGQQPQQSWDQPAHGTQIPDYSTAPGYTQGPGQSNPDYQAPQQNSPQQPQQGNQNQQPQQGTQNQQPSQAPSQTQQPDQNDQQDQGDQQRQQQCEQQAEDYGMLQEFVSLISSGVGGAGSVFKKPDRGWQPAFECSCAPNQQKPQSKNGPCDWPVVGGLFCETVTGTAQPDPNVTPTKPKEPECKLPEFNPIEMRQAPGSSPHESSRGGKPIKWIILHTESPPVHLPSGEVDPSDPGILGKTAQQLGEYLWTDHQDGAGNDTSVSYHWVVDSFGNVVSNIPESAASWSAANANSQSINLNFAGSGTGWSREVWLKNAKALDMAAFITARAAKQNGIPLNFIRADGSGVAPTQPGIAEHAAGGADWGGHHDVGEGFPWDVFQQKVEQYTKCLPS